MATAAVEKRQENVKAEEAKPMWKIVLSQFLEHRMAVAGSIVILIFVSVAAFAPLISKLTGIGPNDQNVFQRYQPFFSTIETTETEKEMALESFQNENPEAFDQIGQALIDGGYIDSASAEDALYDFVLMNNVADTLRALREIDGDQIGSLRSLVSDFSTFHIFGTDELGRDVFIRLVYGTRVSITVGLLVALASAIIGLLIGSLAGYYGGILDAALMRVTDAFLSLPTIPLFIVIAATDFNKIPIVNSFIAQEGESMAKLVFILCLTSWMTVARLVRSSTLSVKEREFIQAAKTLGAKDSVVILQHVFPNVIAPLLVAVTLGVGNAILFEAALSFLGLGIQPPTPSWGNMLFNAQELIYEAPALAILPGILIYLTVVSFNYVGDGLQDAIDPKAIRR